MAILPPYDHILLAGFLYLVSAPTAELAHAKIEQLTGETLDATNFAAAVAALLRDGLIRDPIRLEDQALQCHWRLELTPEGVARARTLTGA
jgi:hypothetical protein